ncbi:MAG: barstar family protein [Lachnospiraceae bacterium]|nr:barstar family protein [Lachnospiraceae bacterium]MBP5253891.1 barstar family protein [Lachnospiraceae bacterium]
MKRVFLDFRFFGNKSEVHRSIRRQLDFPDYYGNNLDALHDCLTEPRGEIEFFVTACGREVEQGFLAVLLDSAEENPHLTVHVNRTGDAVQ